MTLLLRAYRSEGDVGDVALITIMYDMPEDDTVITCVLNELEKSVERAGGQVKR
jgi:hypothetical protein